MGNSLTGPFRRCERHRKENSRETSWHATCFQRSLDGRPQILSLPTRGKEKTEWETQKGGMEK